MGKAIEMMADVWFSVTRSLYLTFIVPVYTLHLAN